MIPTNTFIATKKEGEESKFQVYSSSRVSMRMLTEKGTRITFANYKFITSDPESIAYLDAEIKNGLQSVTKGEELSTAELDPMHAVKKKAVEDYLAQQAVIAAGTGDGGNSEAGSKAAKLNAVSTKQVTNS